MNNQVIISISREFGSGGRAIAQNVAKSLNLPLYDRNILSEISNEDGNSYEDFAEYDEKPRNPVLTRTVRGQCNSVAQLVAEMQFDFLRDKAKQGESFVVLGRCSEEILKEFDGLISIFIRGDEAAKLARVMEQYDLSESKAAAKIKKHDRTRRQYHNSYSTGKWGEAGSYDLCINSSKLGIDKTTDELLHYIQSRTNN